MLKAQAAPRPGPLLLKTKLFVPRPPTRLVPRPRLLDRLDDGCQRRLTLVSAPPGYGKSTVLAEWSLRCERAVVWMSVDVQDNDPVRFWSHLFSAIAALRPGLGEAALASISSPQSPPVEVPLALLINDIVEAPMEFALVIDDYHLVENEAVHRGMTFLLDHLPPRMNLVISTRIDPPLPLPLLRGRGELVELRADELRLSETEIGVLLGEVMGVELPTGALPAIEERTEGWVAGVQLTGLSLRDSGDVMSFVGRFAGTSRHILDYLVEEVLQRQPESVRRFLLLTSILDRMNSELCDEVVAGSGSKDMLETLERANLFLVPLDDDRCWYRYHHLFADVLRSHLHSSEPTLVPTLHARACGWLADQGAADDAIRHALAAGDPERAARLIELHAEATYGRGQLATLVGWLDALPSELLGRRPRLLLCSAAVSVVRGQFQAVEAQLEAAEAALAAHGEPEAGPGGWFTDLGGFALTLRATLAYLVGDPVRTIELSRQALTRLPADTAFLHTAARSSLAHGLLLAGELAQAKPIFRQLSNEAHQTSTEFFGWLARHALGRIGLVQGRLREAEDVCREAQLQRSADASAMAGATSLVMGEVLRERNDLVRAADQLAQGIDRCRQTRNVRLLSLGYASLAWVHQSAGREADARQAMAEAEKLAPQPRPNPIHSTIATSQARLHLAQGNVDAAAAWAEAAGVRADDSLSYAREQEHITLARLFLDQGRTAEADDLLGRLLVAVEAGGRYGSAIDVLVLQALSRNRQGDRQGANAALARALRIAEPEGHVRVFADHGPEVAAVLTRLLRSRHRQGPERCVAPHYLARLIEACTTADPNRQGPPTGQPLPVPLTTRELEVLRLLASGSTNAEMAAALFVAQDTVKKHLSHVFEKLGVRSRTGAVARGRQLGLLD